MEKSSPERLGEFELIRQIQQQAGSAAHLIKGIGDDCAIQRQQPHLDLLTTTDLLIEGVHFDLRWTSLEDLGRKAVAVNVSDIAAMGGMPQSLFLSLACSERFSPSQLQKFLTGFLAATKECSAVLAGGDTSRSPGPLMISVTAQGVVETGQAACRSGARPGDAIYVSGTLGESALALSILQRGDRPAAELLDRHNVPQPRVALGRALVQKRLPSAMLDISDGLLGDLGHITDESAVGADLELDALPLAEAFRTAMVREPELLDLALTGGEDYELLFTSARQDLAELTELNPRVTRIGQVSATPGIRVRRADGRLYHCARGGFDHFS